MRIEIDEEGHLLLKRGGEMRNQFCPYQPRSLVQCGDWCPLFEEPSGISSIVLDLCGDKSLRCARVDFIDRRGE